MPAHCESCQKSIAADADNRLPPWCPHCGGNIKKGSPPAAPPPAAVDTSAPRDAAPAPAPVALRPSDHVPAPLTWREPEAPASAGDLALEAARAEDDGSLTSGIDRIKLEQRERDQKRHKSRLAGLGAMAAGILILAAVFGLNAFLADNGRIVIPVKLSLLGFMLTGIGGYTLFSGHDICNLRATELYEITVGPEGISRCLAHEAGPSALSEGWALPWGAIASLTYTEDDLLGPRCRTLEIRTKTGEVERVRIADGISQEQLAAQAEAWGHRLEVGQAGDWNRHVQA